MDPFLSQKAGWQQGLSSHFDPRIKIVAISFFMVAVIFTPYHQPFKFMMYFLSLLLLAVIERIPWKEAIGKVILLGPLLLFLGLSILLFAKNEPQENFDIIWNISLKSGLTFFSLLVLTLTTDFYDLIRSLEYFKVPRIIPALLSFAYRYNLLLQKEARRMLLAKEARSFGKKKKIEEIKTLTKLLPHIFLRSLIRSERIYAAMLARGYRGKIQTLKQFKLKQTDFFFIILFLSVITAIWVWA